MTTADEPGSESAADQAKDNGDQGTGTNPPEPSGFVSQMVRGERFLSAVFLFLIVATMGTQVFARYFFGAPFPWSEEAARLALIWMAFLSASFVMAEGRHITVDLLSPRLSDRGKVRLECLSHAIVAGACLLLLIGGSRFVWYVGRVGSPALGIPKSLWYGAVSVGLLLMTIHSLVNLYTVVTTGKPLERDPGSDVAEEEGLHLEMEQSE